MYKSHIHLKLKKVTKGYLVIIPISYKEDLHIIGKNTEV